jgi:predicted nucleic acid-binding protein
MAGGHHRSRRAISVALRGGQRTRAQGCGRCDRSAALLGLELPTVDPDDPLLVNALAITARHPGVTVYDAAYHALALRVDGVFVTADERYFRRTKRLGAIELLSSRT